MKKSEIKSVVDLLKESKITNIKEYIKYNTLEDKCFLITTFLSQAQKIKDINMDIIYDLYEELFISLPLIGSDKNYTARTLFERPLLKEIMDKLSTKTFFKTRLLLFYTIARPSLNQTDKLYFDNYFSKEELKKYENKKIIDLVREEFRNQLLIGEPAFEDHSLLIDQNQKYVIELSTQILNEEKINSYSKKIGSLIHSILFSYKKLGLNKKNILNIYNNIYILIKETNRKELVKLLYIVGLKEQFFEYISNRKITIAEVFDIVKIETEDLQKILIIYEGKKFKRNAFRLYTYFKENNMIEELLRYDIIDLDSKEFDSKIQIRESLKALKLLVNF